MQRPTKGKYVDAIQGSGEGGYNYLEGGALKKDLVNLFSERASWLYGES
ncbi:MAG: hypothetical protein KAJ23_10425 [Maribacter sp.]|nr:hypothetical protein [Maribacter sp.]